MKEILFRGKRVDNGNWIVGYYVKGSSRHCIVKSLAHTHFFNIIPETIGQFTGLTDKNCRKIFEGDIIKIKDRYIRYVVYSGVCASFVTMRCVDIMQSEILANLGDYLDEEIEIIGNIYDNKELLEV